MFTYGGLGDTSQLGPTWHTSQRMLGKKPLMSRAFMAFEFIYYASYMFKSSKRMGKGCWWFRFHIKVYGLRVIVLDSMSLGLGLGLMVLVLNLGFMVFSFRCFLASWLAGSLSGWIACLFACLLACLHVFKINNYNRHEGKHKKYWTYEQAHVSAVKLLSQTQGVLFKKVDCANRM